MNGRVQQRRRGNPPWLPSDGQAQGPRPYRSHYERTADRTVPRTGDAV